MESSSSSSSRGTKRARSPPTSQPESETSIYIRTRNLYHKVVKRMKHEYDPNTPHFVKRVTYISNSEHDARTTEKQVALMDNASHEAAKIYVAFRDQLARIDQHRDEWTQHGIESLLPKGAVSDNQRVVAEQIVQREYDQLQMLVTNQQVFFAAYFYYYLSHKTEYKLSMIPQDSRQYLFIFQCSVDPTKCDPRVIKRGRDPTFDAQSDLFDQILVYFSSNISVINRMLNTTRGSGGGGGRGRKNKRASRRNRRTRRQR